MVGKKNPISPDSVAQLYARKWLEIHRKINYSAGCKYRVIDFFLLGSHQPTHLETEALGSSPDI